MVSHSSLRLFAAVSLFILSVHGFAQTWYEAVDCIACVTSGSTYTWWQEKSGYSCSDSVWDETICDLYSDCTFQASTCEVSTS